MSFERRFGGVSRLYGRENLELFRQTRVAVVGLGGVGSWAAEAIGRTGFGHLILMDMDDICITNTNRQIHALAHTCGRPKAEVMAERLAAINPDAEITPMQAFYTAAHPDRLFGHRPDLIVDAIDSMNAKAHLIAACHERGLPLVTCGGAGGRTDAGQVQAADLARTHGDGMLSVLRRKLRREYGLPLGDKCPEIGIPCVFSPEKPRFPQCDGSVGERRDEGFQGRMACDSGFGAATHVTGVFGFLAASAAIALLLARRRL
ncbi:MAG: tRNA threonylcarbamoyladenosine dehydratase [Akkermansiaceae bacterium]|nr:tRNA threonylcarbamoyladenosine dehydratase [Akkermansiaceae bacterium]